MTTPLSCLGYSRQSFRFCLLPAWTMILGAAFLTGCGGGGNSGNRSSFSGNTAVVLLGSSTANDEMNAFELTLDSLTMTNKSGETVTVLASPVGEEFIHLNGRIEPLLTVSIPQGVYVSATATYGGVFPFCVGQASGEDFQDQMPGAATATVSLPYPITVTGTAMGLELNLQIANYPAGCPTPAQYATAPPVTSSIVLTPVTFAAQPTTTANGMALGLQGSISSVGANGSGFVVNALSGVQVTDPPVWQVSVNSSTLLQGVAGFSQIAAGMPVDMDVAIQPDGSLLATRVEVISTDTTTLTVAAGNLMSVSNYAPVAFVTGPAQQGHLPLADFGLGYASFGNAEFQTSGQFSNLASLPFNPSFSGTSIIPGQNVTITTQATAEAPDPVYIPAATMTLMPQTIDGTVSAIASQGNFTTYTVTLAPYDLFPQFAVQPGQTTLLTSPNTVVVYADNNTLNSSTVAVGSVLRFYGLIFNDNGTLRMDCASIDSGVTE